MARLSKSCNLELRSRQPAELYSPLWVQDTLIHEMRRFSGIVVVIWSALDPCNREQSGAC